MKESTGCENVELADDVYDYFARPEAWTITPGAVPALLEMKAAGEDGSTPVAWVRHILEMQAAGEGGGMTVTWMPHRKTAEAVTHG